MTLLAGEIAPRLPVAADQALVQGESPRQRLVDYLVFTVITSLYLIPFMRLLLLGTDEGLFISGAVRIAQGQVFARDFFEIVGPGTFYWLALFFKLFGVTFFVAHACLFVTSLATGLLMYFLSRRVCSKYRILPSVIIAGTSFGMIWPTVSHHANSNCISLAAVACVVLWLNYGNNILLLLAGSLAGITTFFHLPKGIFLLCAMLAWLWTQNRRLKVLLPAAGWLVAGYGSVVGVVVSYFWSKHALWDLFNANYLFPSQHYGAANKVPYALGILVYYWKSWVSTSSGFSLAVMIGSILIIPFLMIAVLPVFLPIGGILRPRSLAKAEIALYWLTGSALWLSEYHRKDIWHLVFGSPILIILCVFYLEKEGKLESVSLQILAISATCLTLFNLILALTAHPMMTRVGSVAVFGHDSVVAQLDRRTGPGEELFVYPYDPIYYFLSRTKNPVRFSGLMYDYNSREEFEDVVHVLDRHRVKYVLWDTGYAERVFKLYFPSVKPVRPDKLIIEPYLESHYKTVWVEGDTRLLERKE